MDEYVGELINGGCHFGEVQIKKRCQADRKQNLIKERKK
jgi:hypothetical protein